MMRSLLSRFARNNKGATAVEFAIILPVLLLFVFGIIEWGLYMYNRQVITNAAREGARYGVLMRKAPREVTDTDEDPAIKAKVLEFADTYLVTFGDDKLTSVDPVDDEGDIIITRTWYDGEDEYSYSEYEPEYPPDRWSEFGSDLTVQINYKYDFLFLTIPPLNLGPLLIKGASTMKME